MVYDHHLRPHRPLTLVVPRQLIAAVFLGFYADGEATVTRQADFACKVPGSYGHSTSVDQRRDRFLRTLVGWNCLKVDQTAEEYRRKSLDPGRLWSHDLLARDFSAVEQAQSLAWSNQAGNATELCTSARNGLVVAALEAMRGQQDQQRRALENAALLALNAWGTVMAGGHQCCNLPGPPYCVDTRLSAAWVLLAVPFGVLLLLFVGSLATNRWCATGKGKTEPDKAPSADVLRTRATGGLGAGAAHTAVGRSGGGGFFSATWNTLVGRSDGKTASPEPLAVALREAWQNSCLRALPEAERYAESTTSLFCALQHTFDFQADNVKNQHEHLLSLWRSQCAIVADRSVGKAQAVDETGLLAEALGDLHAELLDGCLQWREKMQRHGEKTAPQEPGGHWPLAGAAWTRPEAVEALPEGEVGAPGQDLNDKLAEVVTYLLVWGEAGNLRFMPELLYFITELALRSKPSKTGDLKGLYGEAPPLPGVEGGAGEAGPPFRSNSFLVAVVRPVYNTVFEEWYVKVDVNAKNQRDVKQLKPEYENFLKPDVANYDDWNELFCEPRRLTKDLVLKDVEGDATARELLFDKDQGDRFAELWRVDWASTLRPLKTKTHREMHSLWGVFGTTHRVWLVHMVLFVFGVIAAAGKPDMMVDGWDPVGGLEVDIRFAAAGLLVPLHATLWCVARGHAKGLAAKSSPGCLWAVSGLTKATFWCLPIVTFVVIRWANSKGWREGTQNQQTGLALLLAAHFTVSVLGLIILLFVPKCGARYRLFSTTHVPTRHRFVRYAFWVVVLGVKFLLGTYLFRAVYEAMLALHVPMLGLLSPPEVAAAIYSPNFGAGVLLWFLLWAATFFLFLSDTQMWFTIACAFLGMATMFVQRNCMVASFALEDAVSKIPERLSDKVLPYATAGQKSSPRGTARFSPYFPMVWDRVIQYMRYEDKVDYRLMGDLSFSASLKPGDAGNHVTWEQLNQPLGSGKKEMDSGMHVPTAVRVKVPDLFRGKSPIESGVRQVCAQDPLWPDNPDVQWRLIALARGLGLPIPRPFRAPYIPGITVLIPHYGESILMVKKELFQEDHQEQRPLMHWLMNNYEEEFAAFLGRMQGRSSEWPVTGSEWGEYTDKQWDKMCSWASMRMQTLWRTVAGMCLYHNALQAHFDAQADRDSSLSKMWNPNDCFTCLVSMQMYAFFDKTQLEHTNLMFQKFPSCLKVAFIDYQGKGRAGDADQVHERQHRRYFSCLLDSSCAVRADGKRTPLLRIELPGYPILGDGKSDNQNHAIPFTRGSFAQCIDANQGAYFEQMLLLPCALGEFRTAFRGDPRSKRIIGFPEHITSDIGSIGDFAASAEVAFGTILQRTYSVLGARMHYGHPDIMNKLFMMQQGGVSKATKTLNLSEDIFAGMDFTLRGQGRTIHHREYFHLAKGRDLGFNTVLGFFSKLSSGTGEQVITRQAFRLGQILQLPEALTFYYAHVGYYFTQFFISMSMPILVFVWLLALFSDCEDSFPAFLGCVAPSRAPAAEVLATLLSVWFSRLLLLFLVATSLPLFVEVWMERSLLTALIRFMKQLCTLSPLMFIFQGKIIGHYVVNELRYGGATYVSTGRGLPTERRAFLGEVEGSWWRPNLKKVDGLYLDYAAIAYYDGAKLLCGTILVAVFGKVQASAELAWVFLSLALVICSWLFGPFVFNPYQFHIQYFSGDLKCLAAFFLQDNGRHWVEWYERTQLKRSSGRSVIDISFFIGAITVVAWYAMMDVKSSALSLIFSEYFKDDPVNLNMLVLVPPFILSTVFCFMTVGLELLGGLLMRALRRFDNYRHPENLEVDDAPGKRRCSLRMPLALSSVCVLALDILEAVIALLRLHRVGWERAFVAGLMLKWGILSLLLKLAEGSLRFQSLQRVVGRLAIPLELWVRAHRMLRDILTSSLIIAALTPLVLLNRLNDFLCPGLSFHHLLIYRNPNHLQRSVQEVRWGESEDVRGRGRSSQVRQPVGDVPAAV